MRRSVEGGWKRSVYSEPRWSPILLHAWFGGGHSEKGSNVPRWVPTLLMAND